MQIIGRNIFSLGLSRIVSGIVLFSVNIKLIEYLGPDSFGRLSLIMAYFFILLLFVDLGVSRFVIKKTSENKSIADVYLGNFILTQSILALLGFLLFVLIPIIADYTLDIRAGMILAGAGLVVTAMGIPFSAISQAWQKIHVLAVVNMADTIVKSIWYILAIIFQKDIIFVLWVLIIAGIVDTLIYFYAASKIVRPRFSPNPSLISRMFIYGMPFAFVSGFEILIQKVGVILQKMFLTFTEVGLYAAAYRFLDFLTFIPAVVAISLFPYFSAESNLSAPEVKRTIHTLNRYLAMIAFPLGVGSTILGREIIITLFGSGYEGAVLPFQILIWATVLTLLYAVPNVMLIVKRIKVLIVLLSSITGFNIISNIIFIPRYGIVASAWITVLSYAISAVVYIIYAKRLVDFTILKICWMPILGALVMGSVLLSFEKISFPLSIGFGAVVYGLVLLVGGFFQKDDWNFLRSIFIQADK